MKLSASSFIFFFAWLSVDAQLAHPDTVVVELASSSKIVFTISDHNDLQQLGQYDYQALFEDIFTQIRQKDSLELTQANPPANTQTAEPAQEGYTRDIPADEKKDDHSYRHSRPRYPRSHQYANFDFGLNNYFETEALQSGNSELYAVKPWGSWYIALNAVQHTRFSSRFSVECSAGVSWYNFKFENELAHISADQDGVYFQEDPRNLEFKKSMFGASYLNAAIVPVFNAGRHRSYSRFGIGQSNAFRIGIGAYAGYRLGSFSRQQYEVESNNETDKENDSFHMSNFRYGVRLQMGAGGFDCFFNYDLNSLFRSGNGPELNAYSFGVIF